MGIKEELAELMKKYADETEGGESETVASEATETKTGEEVVETDTGEKEITPSTVESTEVIAPEVVEPDITIVQADDVLAQTIDMRLASFYTKQQELENTVKLLLQEVTQLKSHFTTIETAIDTAAKTSPTVENMRDLIRQV